MALDEERFVHAKLYQTIFPSVFYQRCLTGLARIDRCTGQMLAQLMIWSEKKFFGGWDDMHKLRFDQPEEDDGFFVYSFVTEAIYLQMLHLRFLLGGQLEAVLQLQHVHRAGI